MKVMLYSPTHHHKELYDAMEKKYKSLGYIVCNPMNDGDTEEEVLGRVEHNVIYYNMLICISNCGKNNQIKDLRKLCRRNYVIFRVMDDDTFNISLDAL